MGWVQKSWCMVGGIEVIHDGGEVGEGGGGIEGIHDGDMGK